MEFYPLAVGEGVGHLRRPPSNHRSKIGEKHVTLCWQPGSVIAALALATAACSSSSPSNSDTSFGGMGAGAGGAAATGGATVPGGAPSLGGAWSTGGKPGTGGYLGSGGIAAGGSGWGGASVSGGGVSTTGGVTANGGASLLGGATSGGAPGVGGLTTNGGSSAGGLPGGGTQAAGGALGGLGGETSGGTGTGGNLTGGTAAGGAENGGNEIGGTETGGTEAGGAENAGNEAGGAANGGTSSGGAGDAEPSDGCGKTPTLTSGKHSIQSGGQERSYILSIPESYDNSRPHRLIFAFHWNGGTSEDIDGGGTSGEVWSYYGLRAQANDTTIFVAPQGNGNGWANPGGQDLTFVDDMVSLFKQDLCVDTTRLFALGFSYGGGMSYSIACSRPTVFRAVAVYSGAQLSGCEGGNEPIAYLGIHGIGDDRCGIDGGRSLRNTFVSNNGCTPQNPPEPASGSLTHTCTTYEGCDAGYPVEWCAFDGGHTPGMVDGGGDDGARTWTKEEVWRFFSQF